MSPVIMCYVIVLIFHRNRTAITILELADIFIYHSGIVLLCFVYAGVPRPLVPLEYRQSILHYS